MGAVHAAMQNSFANLPMQVIVLGLDAAGKTSMLYKLKCADIVSEIPTIGFNVERCRYRGLSFVCWDVGGRDKIRPLWRHYFKRSKGLVFVVDSNDKERLDDARQELLLTLQEDEMADIPLLVFANKQDLPGALSDTEIAGRLGLHDLRNRKWYIQGSSATSGVGLWQGLDWLVGELKSTAKRASTETKSSSEPGAFAKLVTFLL